MEYYELIEKSVTYIEDSLEMPLNVQNICDHFNISKFHFHRIFTALIGMPLYQYLASRRLNRAVQLIEEKEYSLTDIAYRLQFGDQATFTKAFKRMYDIPPSKVKTGQYTIPIQPIPTVVKRPFKNLGGDLVHDFTVDDIKSVTITGVVFEIDLAQPDYKQTIRNYATQVIAEAGIDSSIPKYMVYSNCRPGSSKFNAIFGVPKVFTSTLPNVFTVDIPALFCAMFSYSGDLLEISNVFTWDFAQFLKLSKMNQQENEIELMQIFDPNDMDMTNYKICVPINKLDTEMHDELL